MNAELVIDDPEACRLANDLARLTGDDMTTIVTTALLRELARVHAIEARCEAIMNITREIAASSRYGVAA